MLNFILELQNNPIAELICRIVAGIAILVYALFMVDWANRIFHKER